MGLCIGKAALLGEVYPFTKLSKGAVLKITTAYHNISDGFGISLSEMSDILSEINDYLQMSKESVRFLVSGLFRVLDSDNNGLIDGLEALSVLAVISGMFREDIVAYILSLYDFANLSGLTYDEIILTLKSCVNGLLKIQLLDPNSKCVLSIPQDRIYDEIASNLFSSISTNESLSKNDRVDIRTISLYFSAIPEITAWLEFFNNLDSNNHLGNYRNLEKLSALRLLSGSEPSELALRIDPPVLIRSASLVDQTLQWKSQVTLLSPFNYANSSISHDTPSDEISKTWIYGLESRRGLAKVDYTKLDELVYFTGRYVLIYSHQKNTQKVFTCHRKDIAQVQLHRDSNTIVSAEVGDDPMIFVWSCESLVVQQSFQAIGSTTVSALSFSTEGTRILFIDENFVKNITLWDWKINEIIFRGLIDASIVFSCCLLAPDRFAIAVDDQVKFWNKYHEGFTNKQAIWINNRQPEIVSAMTRTLTGDNLVCGSVTGALLLFHGHSCVRYISAHSGTITSIIQSRDGYITGSKDARIRMWTVALEPRFLFDISKFSSVPIILSLSLSLDASMIVFLTLNSEIFEISALDGSDLRGGPVVQGHRQGAIYDLDTHPGKLEAVTVGSDKTLRVYDLHLCTQIKLANLGFEPTAVAYSPLGDTIAVGSNCSQGNDYKFVILSEESLSILHAAKDSEAIVACVKYSVDGEILAVGCTDGDIFLYSVPDDFDLICKCSRHRKAVFALDFSLEGEWLRSNSIDGEIYFFSVDDGSLQSNLASMRDVNWATQDCIYSWHTKGIHGSIGSSDAIVACSSSNLENPSIVAVGSALGSFRVFRYPCVHDNADFINFQIHTSKIVKIRFTFDNSYILSCGSRDRCLIQFQCRISTRIDIESTPTALPFVLDDLKALKCRDPVFPICSINDFALNQVRSRELSEGFLDLQDVPNVSLSVERVYGYEGISCLSNIFYTSPNDLLYTCSRFALLVNKQTSNQKVFQGHLNVITAIALSHDKQFIATGDLQSVLIWNSVNFEIIFTPQDTRNLPTAALSFSSDRFLMVILIDDLYCMQIYDWKCKILLSKTNLGSAPIYFCTFSDELSSASESKSAITIGKNYFRFWKSVDSNFINGFQPNLQDLNSSSTFLSAVILRNRAVAGSDDGYLALFQDFCLQQKVKSHAGAVTSILFNQNSNLKYYSAGQDGFVRIWSDSFECMKEFNLEGFTKHTITACKAVAVSFDSSSIAVGTFGAEIFEIDVRRNQPIHDTLCYKGHSGQLNGLAIHPTQATFATTSDDAMLRIWNAKAYSHLRCLKLDLSSRALAFSPDGSLLAVGFGNGRKIKGKSHAKEGSILILSFETLKVMQEKKDSSHAISHLKFSPDGKLLLAGSDDCCIYVYAVDDGYALKTIVRNHEAPITGFDVSDDSAALISIDEADRLVFTTLPLGLPIHDSEQILHNLADFCIPKLWYAEGLSSLQIAKQVLTWTSKSRHNPLLASGNNIGQIFVSSFPSKRLCGALMMEGHSSFVSRLGWLADGERLVSIGKSDCSVIQWKLAACGELASPIIGASHHQTLKQPEKTIFLEDESAFWKAMITGSSHIPPKLPLKSKGKNIDFNLQFVEGIGGMALNRTVNYNADGDIVYFSANFAVVFSKHHNEQKFYRQHSFAITCCQLNEKRAFAATGDEDGSIHVWDCRVVTCLLKLEKIVIGPVKDIAFSKDDKTLVVLSSDNFQALLLVQSPSGMWNDGKYSASVNVGCTWPVSWVTFFDQTEYPIVTGGGGPLSYFKVHNGSLLKKLSRYDAQLEASHDITCAINLELLGNLSLPTNTLVCGSSKGFLYVTSDSMSYSRITAHDDAITSIAKILSSLHGGKFATAGRDQKIKLWSSTLEVVKTIDLSKVGRSLGIHFISPLCLSFHSTLSIFLVHFSNGYLIEISPDLSSYLCITQGHYSGKLSAVSFNPSNTEEYASAGEDGTIRIWNWKGRFCSSMQSVPFSSQVIKYTSDGRYIVGGSGESNPSLKNPRVGVLYVLDVPSLSISREEKKSKHSITDIALSQDDSKIAISTFEGMAVICDFQTLQTLAVVNFKYSRPAISLDFSSDETKLKIAFAPDRLAYFDLQASAPIHEPSALIDVKWRSPTWIYSWETQGVFNEEYGDVTALLVKPPHIIVAYQNGDLRLFSFPSIEPQKTSTLIIKLSSFASSIIARDKDKLLVVDSIGRTLLHFQIVEHD